MGSVISNAANGVGTLLGNAFVSPLKTLFGGYCEFYSGVCSGTWDITCFIEHLCPSKLLKLLMVLGLCYITLVFFYLLFKVGICQCVGRSLCKMLCTACETYLFALEDITCFLWSKLKNVKRVDRHRHQFRDVEIGFSSSGESMPLEDDRISTAISKRKLNSERRKDRLREPLYYSRQNVRNRNAKHGQHDHCHLRLKTRDVSVHIKGRSQGLKNLRQLQLRESDLQRQAVLLKRRRR